MKLTKNTPRILLLIHNSRVNINNTMVARKLDMAFTQICSIIKTLTEERFLIREKMSGNSFSLHLTEKGRIATNLLSKLNKLGLEL